MVLVLIGTKLRGFLRGLFVGIIVGIVVVYVCAFLSTPVVFVSVSVSVHACVCIFVSHVCGSDFVFNSYQKREFPLVHYPLLLNALPTLGQQVKAFPFWIEKTFLVNKEPSAVHLERIPPSLLSKLYPFQRVGVMYG